MSTNTNKVNLKYQLFADRLIELRNERKLTQDEVSKGIGISKSSIQKYEGMTRFPQGYDLIEIANFFEVSVEYLLGKSEYKKNQYTSLSELGLNDRAIDTLIKMKQEVYKNGKLDYKPYMFLNALNLLLDIDNKRYIYKIGKMLIQKRAEDQFKKRNNEELETYQYNLFRLNNMFDRFFKENYDKVDCSFINEIESEKEIKNFLTQVNILDNDMVKNWQDYLLTPIQKKLLENKDSE
jgi:transcriptional regulator with XRE-family HTH domain